MVTAAGAIRNKVQMLNVASANYKFAGFHLYLKYFRWQQLQLRVLCEAFILRWQQLQLRVLCMRGFYLQMATAAAAHAVRGFYF